MSFSEDISPRAREEEPYSGCRSLSPLRSDVTLTSSDQRWFKGQQQSQSNMTSLLNKFIQKDKENELLRKENQELKDKLKEFEYLIIKGSEEVKRKQGEIASLNSIIDTLKQTIPNAATIDNLQRQLSDTQKELTQVKSEAAQTQTKLRVEVQREKEVNTSLSKQVAEMKSKLDAILHDSKGSIDDLQKNFSVTSTKYMQLEKEYIEVKTLLKEVTSDNEVKNQTLDHAHQVISKLKQDIEGLVESNENLQKKVKEYKGKCKTLKKNNATQKQQLQDIETKVKSFEQMETELARAKEDLQALMRAKIEAKLKMEETKVSQSQENEMFQRTISELKERVSELEKENQTIADQLSEEQVKYSQVSASLAQKNNEFEKLQEYVKKEEERNQQEMQAFKTQTLRSFQALAQTSQDMLPPLYSKPGSPFKMLNKSMAVRKQSVDAVDISMTGTAVKKTFEEMPPDRKSAGFRRTTPIKLYNSKGGFEQKLGQHDTEINTLSMINSGSPFDEREARRDPRISGFESLREMEVDKSISEKDVQKEEGQKDQLTIAFLTEELLYSIDREHCLNLLFETLCSKTDIEVKEFMKKLEEQPRVNPELEAWRMRSEELEQRYLEAMLKSQQTSDLIFELIKNNKVLSEKLETSKNEYNKLNNEYKKQLKVVDEERSAYQKLHKELLNDSKVTMGLFSNAKLVPKELPQFDPEAIKKVIHDCEIYQNELKSLEEFIDGINSPESTTQYSQTSVKESRNNSFSGDIKRDNGEEDYNKESFINSKVLEMSLLSRLSKKIEMYENKLRQMQEERNDLTNKLNDLKGDIKGWKETANLIEKEYQSALDQKEDAIRKTEINLKRTEALLVEKELLTNKQSERLNQLAERDMSSNIVLQEKEDRIKELFKQKNELCERLEEANQFCMNLKSELNDKIRELSHKHNALNGIQAELMLKDQELRMKEHETEEKVEQIFNLEKIILIKDRELLRLRNENIDLQSQIFAMKEEYARHEHNHNASMAPSRDVFLRTPGTKAYGEGTETRDTSRGASSSHKRERPSLPASKKEEFNPRNSCGSRLEKHNSIDKDATLRQLKEENTQLTKENNELFQKLKKLNELIRQNKELEEEVGALRAAQLSRTNQLDSFSKSPVASEPIKTLGSTGSFDTAYLEKCLQMPEDYQQEKEALRQLKETIKDGATVQFIEKYKAKTKKVFQKRVKELEMLLRFIDQKTKGCYIERSSYIVSSIARETLSSEEGRTLVKLNYLVENMLDKNLNLKEFIDEMAKRIENLYVKNYNLTVLVGTMLKNMFIIANKNNLASNHLGELEQLCQTNIPELVNNIEQIETIVPNGRNSSMEFFNIFSRLEPKIHNISTMLIKALSTNSEWKLKPKTEEYFNSKIEKVKEVENLYQKLTKIIAKNDEMNPSLPDFASDYIQTYNHIYQALISEHYSVLNFTSNLLNGTVTITDQDYDYTQISNPTYESNQPTSTLSTKFDKLTESSKELNHKAPVSNKKKSEDSYTFQVNYPSSILVDQHLNVLESPTPKKEKYRFGSRSHHHTPPQLNENQIYTEIPTNQAVNAERVRGKTQRLSLGDPDDKRNPWMHTSRY